MPVLDKLTSWCEVQHNTTVHIVSKGTPQRLLMENRLKSDLYAFMVCVWMCACACVCVLVSVCEGKGILGMM